MLLNSNKIPETEMQEPKIFRKRGGHKLKKAASFERNSFEPVSGKPKKPNLFEFTMNVLYKNLYLLGITLLRYRLRANRRLKKFRARLTSAIAAQLNRAVRSVRGWFKVFWARLRAPFLRIRRTYREVKPEIISKRAKGKFPFAAYLAVLETIGRLVLKILTTIFNYAAPVAAAVFLFITISQRVAEPKVYVLTYNNEVLGYIDNAAEFNAAARDVHSRVTIDGESAFEVLNPQFEFMRKSEFEQKRAEGEIPVAAGKIEKDELADKLILASNTDVEEAYGLYVNNRFLGAITDKDPVLDKFEEIIESNTTGKPDEEVTFTKRVRLSSLALYPRSAITSDKDMIDIISGNETTDETYIVKEGDSPSLIADKTGVPYDVLKRLNPDIEQDLKPGMEIYTQVARPYMSVETTFTDIVEEEIPYETVKVENATYARGYTDIIQEGVNGLREATYRVSTVDGLERRRMEIGENILKHPVDQRVTVGINNPTYVAPVVPAQPQTPANSGTTVPKPQQPAAQAPSSSGFIRPVPAGTGYISCYLGGYPGHTGIDIAVRGGGAGVPILASADGIVSKVVNSNVGYGRHIMIDHGNGYTTLYAHNSALYVSVGERVRQGQVIAAMGRTGNATGVHVHFEVRYNGQIRNPVDFVGRF